MKGFIKKSFAAALALVMIFCTFSCLAAAELNQDAVDAHYGQYKNYVLLGDSVASGYRDVITDRDQQFNTETKESAFNRIEGSYGDIIADAIIEDQSMVAMAGPGFRTIEIRYMLEDDYAANCTDEYLFYCSNIHSNGDPITKWRPLYKEAVRNADLITLGVGGNDWGAYITWVVIETLSKAGIYDDILDAVSELIASSSINLETIGEIMEIVAINSDAFAEVITTLPSALEYGLSTFYENWDIMIEDIYAYNPDVTLMVVGMSNNGIKGKYYDYDGVEGGPVTGGVIGGAGNAATEYIVDFIMTVGNTPMIEGAKKYGYTYVDTEGTTYVESHPDADGHVYIANKIIEALPDRDIATKYEDVKPGHKYFGAIEYVLKNGIMAETSETTFSPDDALTSGQLAAALNAIKGTDNSTDGTSKVNVASFAFAMISGGASNGIAGFFKGVSLFLKIVAAHNYKVTETITRGEAANYFKALCE
ncbi:MAG: S-layer homology domain-containing protein [Ruminococcaceae bacterium]|nr:S-layer homology domain-containing protein [Oscillospiraceae bacterium]